MAGESRSTVRWIGLEVRDAASYALYRQHMRPILAGYQGRFQYDFEVSQVLEQPEPRPINRVFSIVFPSQQASDAFFADPAYVAVRARYFEGAVGSITPLALFQQES